MILELAAVLTGWQTAGRDKYEDLRATREDANQIAYRVMQEVIKHSEV